MIESIRTVNLREKPFNLDEEAIAWVENTLASMDVDTRIKQVFAPLAVSTDPEYLKQWVTKHQPGAVMFRPMGKEVIQRANRSLQENSPVPLLIAGNLEEGGNGLVDDGTYYGKQLQVAAAADSAYAYELGRIAGEEAAAAGGNWSFGPIVDIDMNWRNPITNLRTFGSNPDTVIEMAKAYKAGFESSGGIVSLKHFPGDGVDERDQHLHVTFNSLSVQEWMESFGRVYRTLIGEGAHTVMVGHIAFPEYSISKGVPLKECRSATVSPELLQTLLRDELGFNGLIVTDATPMIGFAASGAREEMIPQALAAGCDMILFNRDYDEDLHFMRQGMERGIVTGERLADAVRRILGVKASMGLHLKEQLVPEEAALAAVGSSESRLKAKEMAMQAITLVRDRESLLPLSPLKTRRIFLMPLGTDADDAIIGYTADRLTKEGFEVEVQDVRKYGFDKAHLSLQSMKDRYDLALYVVVERTRSNRTQVRLNFSPMVAINAPWFSHEVPSLMISLANPYHLMDAPFISTYINAYSDNETTVEALIEKLRGRSPFTGTSPSDPYCGGRWDLHMYD